MSDDYTEDDGLLDYEPKSRHEVLIRIGDVKRGQPSTQMSDLHGLAAYHADDERPEANIRRGSPHREAERMLRKPDDTERRLRALEMQVAELTRRLDEADGGK